MDFVARRNEENLKLTRENCCNEEKSAIQEFYSGSKILITGGTGFMGKMLIEKLLRSCTDIETIYLLIRPKRGKDIHSRIEEVFDDALFDRLREEVPKFRHKIIVIPADISLAGLGLRLQDREMLISNVSIVFHAAATVRFDENLKLAININVGGIRDLIELCTHMKQLKAMIHVSTVYSNCHLKRIEEKFYEYAINLDDLERLIEKLDEKQLEEVTPTILGQWPNTYTFTKALGEDVVRRNRQSLPIGIFRPAIVCSTVKEPIIGWVDNLYGPTGVVAGAVTGVLRTLHCDKNMIANIVPVDMTVNALIISAWDTAKTYQEKISEEIPIYNYVSSVEKKITWGEFCDNNVKNGFSHPISSAIWYLSFRMHKSALINKIHIILLHLLPAIIVDTILVCIGQKPRLWKVYKKIHKFSQVLTFFCTNNWDVTNDNVRALYKKLNIKEKEIFNFNMAEIDWIEFSHHYVHGIRKYLLKENDSTVEAARQKWNRFYWLHQLLKVFLTLLFVFIVWSLFSKLFLK